MTDAIDLRTARIVNAPDVRAWPVTAAITAISFDGAVTRVDFTKKDGADRWPDSTLPGWEGPIQYTLWLFVRVNGGWVGSGFIQFWHDRDGSGSPSDPDVPSRYHEHWYYSSRWAPIYGHGPIAPGESIGFMVTPGGGARDNGPVSLAERSNIVVLQATDRGTFTFPVVAPAPAPVPAPAPKPTPAPAPVPVPAPPHVDPVLAAIARLEAQQKADTAAIRADIKALRDDTANRLKDFGAGGILGKLTTR